ncbi:AraC family transcriptional regulator [Sphingobium sufflavum]|uniref:helix-turn-helix transcriptional regulator n=1 Tax=Sphingobium sufflavum TaxID=1129547 RepID=UPI001F339D77|nr:AraC family transcriptional regulator [Sphingobium sufflavum]MCE7795078.1 AraC family transcriptional regulator [Sphingobium sufflavum]
MDQPSQEVIAIEGEMATSIGPVRLVRTLWGQPIDKSATTDAHHLQLSLMPMSGRAEGGFPDHWGPHRFEPIGEMFFLPAGERIRTRSNCRHQNAIMCHFPPDAVTDWLGADMAWTDSRLIGMLDLHNANLRRLLFRMGEEIRSPGFGTPMLVDLMARQVVVELARHVLDIDGDQATGGLAPWRLRLIDERLADGAAVPTLEELAALCHMSVRHLTRAFRISRGRSIGSYVADHRVAEARNLLAAGVTVKEVAFAMGFTAPSNFAAAFRRATGETPRDYRQRASGKQPAPLKPLNAQAG